MLKTIEDLYLKTKNIFLLFFKRYIKEKKDKKVIKMLITAGPAI